MKYEMNRSKDNDFIGLDNSVIIKSNGQSKVIQLPKFGQITIKMHDDKISYVETTKEKYL